MKQVFVIGLLLVWAKSLAAVPIDQMVDAGAAGVLDIRNAFGAVSVKGGTRDEVRVTGSLSDYADRLDVRRDGNRIIVRVIYPESRGSQNRIEDGTVLEIAAPASLSVTIDSVTAGIAVDKMQGEQRLSSVSGDIETALFASEVRANTVSGNISVDGRDTDARIDVSSVSGRVDLKSVSGEVSSENVSGSVSLSSPNLLRAEIQTVSGHISVNATLTDDGQLRSRTTSGGITLNLLDSPAGRYELSTFSGRIDNCFGPDPARPQFGPPPSTLQFNETDATTQVYAHSMSGVIALCNDT
jgi:hypothetical protein